MPIGESAPVSKTLLVVDFDYPGPWGEDMTLACTPLAQDIAGEPGLCWKLWTENRAAGRAGGVYLFENAADAERYLAKHRQRLAGWGIVDLEAKLFDLNQPLSLIDRAPLAGASA